MRSNSLRKDQCGLLYSTELLLSIILLVFIIGVMANLSDGLNEKILAEEKFSSLESIASESSDYLLNNPGRPENWEDDNGLDNGIVSSSIAPGLAIKKKDMENGQFYSESTNEEKVISNTISYHKLKKIKNNYDSLINKNLYGDDYNRREYCNHDSNPNLSNHENDAKSYWLCKSFRVYKKSLEEYNYYLISDESIRNANSYWILESINRPNDNRQRLNKEVIDLNPFFMQDLENSSNEIYSIHFNIDKSRINDFKTVLVAIPKNMTDELISNDELRYEYFKVQDVNFVLKIAFK